MSRLPLPTYKIGLNRGRRRIWLDGKPLTACGFLGGVTYSLTVAKGKMVLTLVDRPQAQQRRVTGRPTGKPLVDISGATVDAAFGPEVGRIAVKFEPGVITIKAAT